MLCNLGFNTLALPSIMGDAPVPASGLPPTPAIISGVLHGLAGIAESAAGLMAGSDLDHEEARVIARALANSIMEQPDVLQQALDAAAAAIRACLRLGQVRVRTTGEGSPSGSGPTLVELQGTLDKCRSVPSPVAALTRAMHAD